MHWRSLAILGDPWQCWSPHCLILFIWLNGPRLTPWLGPTIPRKLRPPAVGASRAHCRDGPTLACWRLSCILFDLRRGV